jgi:hypothetical protein
MPMNTLPFPFVEIGLVADLNADGKPDIVAFPNGTPPGGNNNTIFEVALHE